MPERVDQRGPVHDNALRWLAVHDLVTLCRWIGVEADESSVRISEALPATTQYADLVIEVAPGQLAQVEFVTTVGADLPVRMHEYRSRLMRRHPGLRLRQHVLVLGRGEVASEHRDSEHWFRPHVTYLRDCDPVRLLESPSLAPLAPLGRADSRKHRTMLLRSALRTIRRDEPDEARRADLVSTAESLARIYLDGPTIAALGGGDGIVPIDIDPEHWQWAVELNETLERRTPELAELVPTVRAVRDVLRHRFGDDELVTTLAWAMTDNGDPATAVQRALTADSQDELMKTYLALDGS